jgi:predicted PurR-regulated permease PerM
VADVRSGGVGESGSGAVIRPALTGYSPFMRKPASSSEPGDLGRFVEKLLVILAVAVLALIAWRALHVLFLAFGAVLIAIILRALAGPVQRRTRLGERGALVVSVLIVVVVAAALIGFIGEQISTQLVQLAHTVPRAWALVQAQLVQTEGGQWLISHLAQAQREGAIMSNVGGIVGRLGRLTTLGVGAVIDVALVIIGGLYIAAEPDIYRDGLLLLLPAAARAPVSEALAESGAGLRKWLTGTGLAMLTIGAATGVGAALLGLPSPLALGLLSGMAEFVPIVGAIVAAVPALLLAATRGFDTVLWTLAFYVALHQLEGHVVIPLIQRRMVSLPPATTLFAVLTFGILFGPLGVIFATPLAVVLFVVVRRLYVRGALGG